jgi:dihydroorotate dehydrogenase
MGGVQSGRDALDLLEAGASLVAVGTETFRDPTVGERIAAELEEAARRRPVSAAGTAAKSRETVIEGEKSPANRTKSRHPTAGPSS